MAVAGALGGAVAFLAGATPAGSTGGEPTPSVVVTADCPPTGFLPDGQPCVVGPASGSQQQAAPTPPDPQPPAQTTTAPAPPPPQTTSTAAAPAPPAGAPQPVGKDKTAPEPTTTKQPRRGQSTPTRLGKHRVEASKPADKRRQPTVKVNPPAQSAPSTPTASTGGAGLSQLSFNPPSAATPVPDVLLDRFPIPPFLLPIYQAAGTEYEVPWQVLAAINEIETDYGRNTNVSSAGALGWMQFMPSSWQTYGVDANGDGKKDPYNPVDAIFAAARYLKAAGAKHDIRQAIFAYNHATWYVDSVLLRAKLIRQLPPDLVGALTGLTQGRFPIAGPASYPKNGGSPSGIEIDARNGLPVVAVNDGQVKAIGQSRRLGRFLRMQDVYGNTYTYAHLGSVRDQYAAPRSLAIADASSSKESEPKDPKPKAPATAGSHQGRGATRGPRTVVIRVAKERLFAHPSRPEAYQQGGDRQLTNSYESLPQGAQVTQYLTADYPLRRKDLVLRPLRPGAQVVGGAILAQTGKHALSLNVRPAGRGAPAVNPRPVLDGWKLLEESAIYKGPALRRLGARNPTIGQLMLMSKEALARRVLSDNRVRIYQCGRRDIATGAIDRRVLITLEYLASSNLDPLVSALECGHSYLTTAGTVSEHSSGNAADIASINHIPILGHQGPGTITDVTIRRLLTLQGPMKPHQIISLMKFPQADNTLVLADHANHIHVGFYPGDSTGTGPGGAAANQILKPKQWTRLVNRLSDIKNPTIK